MAGTGPTTSLHYAANGNFVNGTYAPGVDGFNLADVSSASLLNTLPSGVKGLVYLGTTAGVTSSFISAVNAVAGSPNLYGFYIADEPSASPTIAANLKAEADYIKAHVPGAVTFMTEQNLSSPTSPSFYYTPANTDINLFGLDPYPIQKGVPNGVDYNIIPQAVTAAEKAGIPLADIVPVYQAFGGGGFSTWTLPTPAQEQQILSTWASAVPNPVFDYAYSWGSQNGDTALAQDPSLAAVFADHNKGGSTGTGSPPPPPPPGPPPPPVQDPPVLTIANSHLTVKGHAPVDLGVTMSAPTAATDVQLVITGLPKYETIIDGQGDRFHGSTVTLSAAQVASGLELSSSYRGRGHPTATLSLVANETLNGSSLSSPTQTITVKDPAGPSHQNLGLLTQYMAGSLEDDRSGPLMTRDTFADNDSHNSLAPPHH